MRDERGGKAQEPTCMRTCWSYIRTCAPASDCSIGKKNALEHTIRCIVSQALLATCSSEHWKCDSVSEWTANWTGYDSMETLIDCCVQKAASSVDSNQCRRGVRVQHMGPARKSQGRPVHFCITSEYLAIASH